MCLSVTTSHTGQQRVETHSTILYTRNNIQLRISFIWGRTRFCSEKVFLVMCEQFFFLKFICYTMQPNPYFCTLYRLTNVHKQYTCTLRTNLGIYTNILTSKFVDHSLDELCQLNLRYIYIGFYRCTIICSSHNTVVVAVSLQQ